MGRIDDVVMDAAHIATTAGNFRGYPRAFSSSSSFVFLRLRLLLILLWILLLLLLLLLFFSYTFFCSSSGCHRAIEITAVNARGGDVSFRSGLFLFFVVCLFVFFCTTTKPHGTRRYDTFCRV